MRITPRTLMLAILTAYASNAHAHAHHHETHKAHHATTHANNTHDQQLISTLSWETKHDKIIPSTVHNIPRRAIICLALNAYHEDRKTQTPDARYITHVTLNRTKSENWGKGICNTVYSTHPKIGKPGYGFSWVIDHKNHYPTDQTAWTASIRTVLKAINEPDPTQGAMYYAMRNLRPTWSRHMLVINTPGTDHRFYKENDYHGPMEVAEYTPKNKI